MRPGDGHINARESGFTLVELLIVVMIIGMLAAIGVPMFLSDRVSAGDGTAKELLHTAQTAAVIYSLNSGSAGYTGMNPAALKQTEPSINTTANGQAVLVNATPTTTGYILTVVSSSADTFNMTNANGALTRTCLVASANGNTHTNTGGGCTGGGW